MCVYWYYDGNPFKVGFRKHRCPTCGNVLSKRKSRRLIYMQSLEARNYDFDSFRGRGEICNTFTTFDSIGEARYFSHKVFRCKNCMKNIEYTTQTNLEDIDILLKKVKRKYVRFSKLNPKDLTIKKHFETLDGLISAKVDKIEEVVNLHIIVEKCGKMVTTMKFPISRKPLRDRPCYFNIKKKDLIWWK